MRNRSSSPDQPTADGASQGKGFAAKNRPAVPTRFAKVLDQCRDIVLIFLDSQMSDMFENAGAGLLDFAERAENNTIQGLFFEAMNLIQQQRPDIEHVFRQQITSGFKRFGDLGRNPEEDSSNLQNSSESELSLVEQEEIEEEIASENLVIRANADYFPELFALSQRLSVICGGKKLKDYQIPAGPHHLVNSFRQSIKGLAVEPKIKVILYALFDKYVIRESKSIYDELNSSLKTAGILPHLKPIQVRPKDGQASSQDTQAAKDSASQTQPTSAKGALGSGQPESLGNELFESIIGLMSTHGRPTGRGWARSKTGPSKPVPPEVAQASSDRLVTALDAVQAQTSTQEIANLASTPGGVPSLEIDPGFLKRVKSTLNDEREQALSQINRDNLSPVDADLIDLIGMLFEYMLNDPVLPNVAKALISHLHTPYLKVALIDRRLLVDAEHPSRRLLDLLVESGSLWVDEHNPKRGIFPAMQHVVDRALKEFTNEISLFEDLLQDFEAEVQKLRQRTDTVEQRTQDAAKGREKLQLAKQHANHQVQVLLRGKALPQPVVDFLGRTWLDLLALILLRDRLGERGEAWQTAVKTANELIVLFEAAAGANTEPVHLERVEEVKRAISEQLKRVGSHSTATLETLFKLLDDPQTWLPQAQLASGTPEHKPDEPASGEAWLGTDPDLDSERSAAGPITEQEREIIARLRKMKFGTWFEFTSSTGAEARRIKLSWLSPLTATCMFVDRSGMQAEIKTLHELAQDILSRRAKVIPRPKHPFIERTLMTIRKVLQGDERAKTKTKANP